MTNYDEYQKFLRYKFGSHSFNIVLGLSLINYSLHLFYDFQWAENQLLEMMLLIFAAILYSAIRIVYSGAYFTKKQNGVLYSIVFAILGIANLNLAFSPYSPLIENGKLTNDIIKLVGAILWLAISLTFFIKIIAEKIREEGE